MPTPDELCAEANDCLKKKDVAAAVKCLEEAIEHDSRHVSAHETLAGLCFLTRDYDRAIQLYQRVSILDPKNSGALVNVGAVQNKKKDFQEAAKTLRLALSKDRRCPEAYYNLGIAQRGLNQMAMAVSAYKEAIRLAPDMFQAYSNLGNVLLEMKNHSQAVLQFRKALEIQPDFKKAKVGLSRAEEATHQAKTSMSPFGRLVDMEEVARQNQSVEKKINLTVQQRFDDRDRIHRLAKESELLAIEFLTQIKDELSNAILELSRLAGEEKHGRAWAEELAKFEIASRKYHLQLETHRNKTDQIREHEKKILNLGEGTD